MPEFEYREKKYYITVMPWNGYKIQLYFQDGEMDHVSRFVPGTPDEEIHKIAKSKIDSILDN